MPVARRSKGKGKKCEWMPRAKLVWNSLKNKKEDNKDMKSHELCKSSVRPDLVFPSLDTPKSCQGCGSIINTQVSQSPNYTDWPASFAIKSAVKFLSATSLQPQTIVSLLSKKWEADFHTMEIVMTKLALIGRLVIIRDGNKSMWDKKSTKWRVIYKHPYHLGQSLSGSWQRSPRTP